MALALHSTSKTDTAMSKSLKRVRAALEDFGIMTEVRETPLARTARDAADALGVELDQIAKSIIFGAEVSGSAVLFLTAGGNRVDPEKAAGCAGEPLNRADAALVRAQTGFAIGGVSPIGHLTPIRAWFDPKLLEFDVIWAAAGTPHHVFSAKPSDLLRISSAQVSDFISQ